MDSNPYLTQIKAELQHYASVEQEIEDVVPVIILGCIELSTGLHFLISDDHLRHC